MRPLRVVLPKQKATERLLEDGVCLAQAAGFDVTPRADLPEISDMDDQTGELNGFELFYRRPEDALTALRVGIADIAVVGRDKFAEFRAANKDVPIRERDSLPFGACRLSFATDFNRAATLQKPSDLRNLAADKGGKLICATSYPALLNEWTRAQGLSDVIEPLVLKGGVEAMVPLGAADLVLDIVESGGTLRRNGLREVFAPLMQSEAILVARSDLPLMEAQAVTAMCKRLKNGPSAREDDLRITQVVPAQVAAFA